MVDSTTTVEELFNVAKDQLSKLESDEVFMLKDLYRGYEWNRIAKGDRTKLGMLFNSYANEVDDIEVLGKTPQNQWLYIKK